MLRIPLAREAKYLYWWLTARLGRRVSPDVAGRATVLITYYDPVRLKHLDSQVRQVLRCGFVERVIVSNHNPAFRIEEFSKVRDPRVVFRNEPVKRGCGHRWGVAIELPGEYLIVIDDDLLLFPSQIARLFRGLLREPQRSHGLAGMQWGRDGSVDYLQRTDEEVDFLCEIYAVTRAQVRRYDQLREDLVAHEGVTDLVDAAADFVVISASGQDKPRIHDVGPIFRCTTFKQTGHAVHMEKSFVSGVQQVVRALRDLERRTAPEKTRGQGTGRLSRRSVTVRAGS